MATKHYRVFAFAATALAVLALAPVVLAATADRTAVKSVSAKSKAASMASAKVVQCTSAGTYADRRLSYRGRMRTIGAGGKMEMKFDVYRRYREQRSFQRLSATGLGQWLANTEPATTYVRNLPLTGIETAAMYKSRVAFRWLDGDGKVVASTRKSVRNCNQRSPLPDLVVRSVEHVPASGLTGGQTTRYIVTVYNKGKSSATNRVAVSLIVNGIAMTAPPPAATLDFDAIPSKSTAKFEFTGLECAGSVAVAVDPLGVERETDKTNNELITTC